MRWSRLAALLATPALLTCSDQPVSPGTRGPGARSSIRAAVDAPPGASVSSRVIVPASMREPPLDQDRFLLIPPDFTISVFARIVSPRFLAVAPNGDLLVSRPAFGEVTLLRSNDDGDPAVYQYVSGLKKPHDIVFRTIGGTTYVYIAESNQINRYVYIPGATFPGARQVVVASLPDADSPGLGGQYGHELKNIAFDQNSNLYVSIASSCNACISDTQSDPVRGSIYRYDADGSNGRLFARGLRNAEGLALAPGTNDLWVVVNNRDNIAYPFDDGTGNYGRIIPSYVDDHPPEAFALVRDGGNYGWPFCDPNPDTPAGLDDMPFVLDFETNRTGAVDCGGMDRITKGIQAHSAPLGLTFLQSTDFAPAYREGAVVALHGSWNRTSNTGYKVIYFPWDAAARRPAEQIDLVTGWATATTQWGRPVDVAVTSRGALYISDDYGGAIYTLTPSGSTNQPPVARFTRSCDGLTCTFDGRGSSDDSGITDYAWDLDKSPDRFAGGSVVTATYPHEGMRTVVLTVTDAGGQTGQVSQTFSVGAGDGGLFARGHARDQTYRH